MSQQVKLGDFKVGTKVCFRDSGPVTEIISIDLENGSWVGQDYDGQALYPLDEVEKHWTLVS